VFRALINVCRYGPGILTNSSQVKAFCARTPFLSSLYYCLVSRRFRREHFSVLTACCRSESGHLESVLGNLRRNIHRIEKGLHTRPRKRVFALDYVLGTVRALKQIKAVACYSETYAWGCDALGQYFEAVPREGAIAQAHDEFVSLTHDAEPATSDQIAHAGLRDSGAVSYDDFMTLCMARRSVRYYEDKPVPRRLIEQALSAALQSPSACNRQAFELFVVDDKDNLKVVNRLPMGSETFADNMQCLVFVIGNLNAYFDERDRHIIYIDGALMAMSFCLALETLGLSSCIINWPDIAERDEALAQVFKLSPNKRGVLCISVGYGDPAAESPPSWKKTVDETLVFPLERGA
jgi:nitroreductase